MGTTTKMAIPYPEATGLVKDGWEDMKDIATQVDAKSGLVLINTTTFSAVSSQSINDVFSTNFVNYRIMINFDTNSAGALVQMRLRVSGADNTTTNYNHVSYRNRMGSTSFAAYTRTADGNTLFYLINEAQTETSSISFDLFQPFTSEYTQLHGIGTNNLDTFGFAGSFNATTSFTGFSIFPNTGTITGQAKIYGYN